MKGKKILLVEDNPDDQELIHMALAENRIDNMLVTVNDGTQALEYLSGTGRYAGRDLSDKPRMILLDLKLPKVNGLEVLQKMRADPHTQTIPVVVLTSSNEEEDIITSYRLGANSYIRKPVDFDRFTQAVKHLGLYWLSLNRISSED